MAIQLDDVDLKLLDELQRDADRPNVELARIVELSPAATLHRVRRLKESGVIARITAEIDAGIAGLPLQTWVAVTLKDHDDAANRRFSQAVKKMPEVITADWVTGETDALLWVVAQDVGQLQRVLVRLSTRAGAQRIITLLRLEGIKQGAPLPFETRA